VGDIEPTPLVEVPFVFEGGLLVGGLPPVADGSAGVLHRESRDGADQNLLVAGEQLRGCCGGLQQQRHPGPVQLGSLHPFPDVPVLPEGSRLGHQAARLATGHVESMSDISGDREVLGLEGAAPLPFGDPVEDPGVSPCLLGVLPLDGLVQLGVRETVDRLEGIESISHASNVSRG
jgi:hypothetical protein